MLIWVVVALAAVLLVALVVGARHIEEWGPELRRQWRRVGGRHHLVVAAAVVIGLATVVITLAGLGELDSVLERIEHASRSCRRSPSASRCCRSSATWC